MPAHAPLPLRLIAPADWPALVETLSPSERAAARSSGFRAEAGSFAFVLGDGGEPSGVLAGGAGAAALRPLAARLPQGEYRLDPWPEEIDPEQAAVAWAAGLYRFDRYKRAGADRPETRADRLRLGPGGGDLQRLLDWRGT